MRILVIGGSGYVGRLVLPLLKAKHTFRIFDRQSPEDSTFEYVPGDVCDFSAVAHAAEGMDALLYMAMGRYIPYGANYSENVDALVGAMDANVKGLFLSLHASHAAGISHAVHSSTMSLYHANDLTARYFADEEITPDAMDVYGFTKRLGEEVCRNAVRLRGMSVNALRLCFPVSEADWLAQAKPDEVTLATANTDLARLFDAALSYRNGFQAFTISGDYENRVMNMTKAKRLLSWEPLLRPLEEKTN